MALGFRTLIEEVADRPLAVAGELPRWLDGTLVHNGPARFAVGDDRVEHWFDGLGMLQRFDFDGTAVRYSNRFLPSETYEHAVDPGTLETRGEFTFADALDERARTPLPHYLPFGFHGRYFPE